jgi:hypothetical protein
MFAGFAQPQHFRRGKAIQEPGDLSQFLVEPQYKLNDGHLSEPSLTQSDLHPRPRRCELRRSASQLRSDLNISFAQVSSVPSGHPQKLAMSTWRWEPGAEGVQLDPDATFGSAAWMDNPVPPPISETGLSTGIVVATPAKSDTTATTNLARKRPSSAAEQTPRKRRHSAFASAGPSKLQRGNQCDNSEDDTVVISSPRPEQSGSTFACPFYRLNPVRHRACINLKLTRIRDVKQHIQRRHTLPGFCCPICRERFDSAFQRDDHIRERACTFRDQAVPDFLDCASLDRLKNRANRNLSPVEQWQAVWDILFPGTPKPTSPYLGSQIEESISILRDFWKQEGQQIVADVLRDSEQTVRNNQPLPGLLFDLFDEVQVRLSRRLCENNGPYHFDNYPTTHRQRSLPLEESHLLQTAIPASMIAFPIQPVSAMSDAILPPSVIPASWDDFSGDLGLFATPTKLDETQHSSTEQTSLDSATLLSNVGSSNGNYQPGITLRDRPPAQRSGLIDSPLSFPALPWDQLIQVGILQA